jgi:hypothetical protein
VITDKYQAVKEERRKKKVNEFGWGKNKIDLGRSQGQRKPGDYRSVSSLATQPIDNIRCTIE